MPKSFFILSFLVLLIIPVAANAGFVPCGNPGESACTLDDFFIMLARIYNFIVKVIATPLAVLAFSVGGIMMMSAGVNPNLANTGKKIMLSAFIGIILAYCSFLIINFIVHALGYTQADSWWTI